MDAGNLLKPMLARGELHCIGATTLNEYHQYIEKDPALERRFQPVMVDEPSVEDTISILRGLKNVMRCSTAVKIQDQALIARGDALQPLYFRPFPGRIRPSTWWTKRAPWSARRSDSMPTELDEISRKIMQHENRGEAALKKDTDR